MLKFLNGMYSIIFSQAGVIGNSLSALRLQTDEKETNYKINDGTFLYSNKFYFCLTNKLQANNFKL